MMANSYIFGLVFFLSACTHIAASDFEESSSNTCASRSIKNLNGQIRYFENMNLKIPNCKTYYMSDFDFKTDKAIGPVIGQIEYSKRTTPQYIDITFEGYINWRGKLIITTVSSAKVSNQIKF